MSKHQEQNPRCLFVCETFAQIINAISIKWHMFSQEKADLCVIDTNQDKETLTGRIRESGLFDDVYYVSKTRNVNRDTGTLLRKAWMYANKSKFYADIPNKEKAYTRIFIAGPSMSCAKFYYYFKSRNKGLTLHVYEEGICEYYMFSSNDDFTAQKRKFCQFFFGRFYLDDAQDIYVYNPSMFLDKPAHVSLIPIPKLTEPDLIQCINRVFDFSPSQLGNISHCKYLFIEEFFAQEEAKQKQKEMLRQLAARVGGENVFVKLHPYSQASYYADLGVACRTYPYPMEVIEMNVQFAGITVLSVASSACFNIWNQCGDRPHIVFLQQIKDYLGCSGSIQRLVDAFCRDYPPELIAIPHTMDELWAALTAADKTA